MPRVPGGDVSRELLAESEKRRLQRCFKCAVGRFPRAKNFVFLELFAGTGGLSASIRKQGYNAIAFDIRHGSEFDLRKGHVFDTVRGWLLGQCIAAVWLGTPCSSWSRARHGPLLSNWGPLRSTGFPLGLPNLTANDQKKVREGNRFMRMSALIIKLCRSLGVPVFCENPSGSLLWEAPHMQAQIRQGSRKSVLDFCQYGAPWRKRTTIYSWGAPVNEDLCFTCSGRKGLCSRTGAPHIILTGRNRVSGQLWTRIAEAYTSSFCHVWAKHLVAAFVFRRFSGSSSLAV